MAEDASSDKAAYAQLALGMILFGSATPVSKLVGQAMPVFIGSGLRGVLGTLVLLPLAWWARGSLKGALRGMSGRDWWLTIGIAVFGMFGFTALLLLGMRMISGVAGSIVMSTTPAVTAAAAILLLGEKLTWRKAVAVGLAVGGVVLLHAMNLDASSGGGGGGDGQAGTAEDPLTRWIQGLPTSLLIGSVLVFGAVCCEASYTLLGRRVSQDVDSTVVALLGSALAIPLFVPLAWVQWPSFDVASVGWVGWSAVVWYGAGTLALGSWLWYAGVSQAQGSVAAGFMGLMPVSALVLSYVLLGEQFQWLHLLGFGVVFAGVLLMSWEHARMSGEHGGAHD
jgi:drug/metabolite transporter (DMT)-like permease